MNPNRGRNSSTSWVRRSTRFAILTRDGWRCSYCWKDLTVQSATLDHLVPESRGGTHKPANLVAACLRCNSSRSDAPVRTFIRNESMRRGVSDVARAVDVLVGEIKKRVRRKLDREAARQLAQFERAVKSL